ncbi:Hint domain-containing protein [Paracoccus sediminicola]|uniref:Hint domain-containing protein n=1 Tax=Paracoccus sediminicola TaxID=3017783 RepID=UPI0022EFF03D|nr:Hint domain-containing protein [Paracoccus sediminicola]WBU57805.1 Hint domain-containing protein [Paracoccus sediminicola]
MADYSFGGLLDADGAFTWVSGGTNPGLTIDEASNGLPEVSAGQVFTYNGGGKEAVVVTDDDTGFLESDSSQQRLAEPATINGVSYGAGTQITSTGLILFRDPDTGTEYTVYTGTMGTNSDRETSATEFYIWQDGKEPPDGTDLTVVSRSQPRSIPYSTLPAPCFCNGTLIETPDGPRPVEDLSEGDLVITASGRAMPILWIGSREVQPQELLALPNLRPVVISAGSLGKARPATDLMLSPQHRVRISSAITQALAGTAHVLIPAIKLLGVPGVRLHDGNVPFTYFHLLLEAHSCVLSNGAWTESLYLGKEFLGSLSAEGRAELEMIFPELFDADFRYPLAAPIMSRRKAVDRLIAHHLSESSPLS